MKKAFVISDEAFRRLCKLVKPGMSELEGAAELVFHDSIGKVLGRIE